MYRQFETFKSHLTWNELKEQRDKNQIELDKRISSLKAFRKEYPAKIHPNTNFKYIDQNDQKIIKSAKQVSERTRRLLADKNKKVKVKIEAKKQKGYIKGEIKSLESKVEAEVKKIDSNIKKQGQFFNNLFGIKVEAESRKSKVEAESRKSKVEAESRKSKVEAESRKRKSQVDKLIEIAKKTIKNTKILTEDKVLTEEQIKILNNLKKAKIATENKKYKVEAESKKKKVQTSDNFFDILGNFFNNLFGIKIKKNIKAEDAKKTKAEDAKKTKAEDAKKTKLTLAEKRKNKILADLKSLANDKKILAKSLKLSEQTAKKIKNQPIKIQKSEKGYEKEDVTLLVGKRKDLTPQPDKIGNIIAIGSTILAFLCVILALYNKQSDILTLSLITVVIALSIVSHCTIGSFCIGGETLWNRSRLGRRCTYKKEMYFSALITGALLSYILFSRSILLQIVNYFKKIF